MDNTVIACVDGSSSTHAVCEYAAWVTGKLNVPLALLHVLEKNEQPVVSDLTGAIGIDSREQLTQELARIEGERNRLLMTQGRAILAGCAELLGQIGIPNIQQLQKHGTLDIILADLNGIHMMVLGRRGAQHPVGSNLESIIRLQKKPVMIVPEAFSVPSRVMFAFDGSEASRRNLHQLTLSSLLQGMECHIVMVNGDAHILEEAKRSLQSAGISAISRLAEGHSVTDVLCQYASANDMDLIIMGAYGHSSLRRFIIGSNTTAMLEQTHVPLLMLR
ncbi:universal stress protein [Salmonella enterica]|uniref:universal stress protein n=1 Tax=Salmonella enterica TaxID=28901 RepID=UPI0009AFCE39|nr:universal stress protein [Salmonella enterica]ECC7843041.1 universal stress protein [Salmonella enterica]